MISVEEAAAELDKSLRFALDMVRDEYGPEVAARAQRDCEFDRDLLILAVKASMPCYRDYGSDDLEADIDWPFGHWCQQMVPCSSCTARRTLQEREAVQG